MVNDENFGELLIEGLEEMLAHQRGETPWVKTVRRLRPGIPSELLAPDPADDDDEDADEDPDPRRRW